MFNIKNVKVYDIDESVRASKYPMSVNLSGCNSEITNTVKKLALSEKGEGHDQFLTGIRVAFDLTCSNKMWTEAERYRFLEFVSSQSTMHRITKFDLSKQYNKYVDERIVKIMTEKVSEYNQLVDLNDVSQELLKQKYLEILYSNPAGFELTARLTTNYRCLKTIYSQRKNHRLPEWREFCMWVETLPNAHVLITGGEAN